MPVVFALLLVQSLLVQYIASAIRPALSYAIVDSALAVVWLSALAAVYALPSLALAIPSGVLVDRWGERPIMVTGSGIVLGAVLVVWAGPGTLPYLLTAAGMLGLGHLLSVVAGQAMVANMVPAKSLDSMFGLHALTASLGQALGPLTLAIPGSDPLVPPLDTVYFVCLVSAVLLVGLTLGLKSSGVRASRNASGVWTATKDLLHVRGLAMGLVASSVVLSSVDILIVYLPLIGQARGLPVAAVSLMLAARAIFSMLSRAFLGLLSARMTRARLMASSVAVSGLAMAAMALPVGVVWLVAFSALFGFVVGICQPLTMSWISSSSPEGSRGLGLSMRLAANRLGQTSIPAALGPLAAVGGGVIVLAVVAVALVITSGAIVASGRETRA